MTDFGPFLLAAAGANRFVEFAKFYVDKFQWSEQTRKSVLVLLSVLAGVVIALMGNLNLLFGVPRVPEMAGVILTGVLAGLGADVVNAVIDLLYLWNATREARVEAIRNQKAA